MTTDTPRTDADIMREAKILKLTKQNYHGLAKSKTAWYATMAKTRDIYEEGEAPQTDDQFRDAAKMVSDTPRTDGALLGEPRSFDSINVVPADFARDLERELNESKEETEDLIFDLNASKAEVERMEKIEIERDEARKELIHNLQTTGGMPWREWSAECAKDGCDECSKAFVIEMLTDERDELKAEVERLKVINADMRNFLSKAIHNEGFNEEQALKFIYQ